jgi:lipoate-protein ligase B
MQMDKSPFLWVYDLDRMPYSSAWSLQKKLVEKRVSDTVPDVVLLTEHNDVLTCGKGLLSSGTSLKDISGLPFHFVERGGAETYHGPGQLMAYPIMKLRSTERDVHRYLRDLEEIIIRTVNEFGLKGKRVSGYTGVWVENKKIASIGIAVKKWVTYHGFALNLAPDLKKFHLIKPCGLDPHCISSMQELLGKYVAREEVIKTCLKHVQNILNRHVVRGDNADIYTTGI